MFTENTVVLKQKTQIIFSDGHDDSSAIIFKPEWRENTFLITNKQQLDQYLI